MKTSEILKLNKSDITAVSKNDWVKWYDKVVNFPIWFVRQVKFGYQRVRYGVDERIIWSYDYYFINQYLTTLTLFRYKRNGSPMLEGFDEDTTHDQWDIELDNQIAKVEKLKQSQFELSDNSDLKNEILDWFKDHFHALWD